MTVEHNFLGTWEILKCTFGGQEEISGLEGIKFRLDDIGDITWYNEAVTSFPKKSKDCDTYSDSAFVLFSCETFDVNEDNPRLIFGAFAGHSIEFKTNTLTPSEELILECENWYILYCRRLTQDQAARQEKEFSFEDALKENYFSDVIISSSDSLEFHVHSVILRLSGFDCSMFCTTEFTDNLKHNKESYIINNIKDNLSLPHIKNCSSDSFMSNPNLSKLGVQNMNILSFSFNCLSASTKMNNETNDLPNKYLASSSDSNLQTNQTYKNIFNFSSDIFLNPLQETMCSNRIPPLSPYRARSPTPLLETPPPSPLTPISVLNNLPSFMLSPILHWLYTESLTDNLDDDTCEKLINFAETQPALIKLVEPCKKYLILIRLKKYVIDLVTDVHNILSSITEMINSASLSYQPSNLYGIFKDCLRECAIGCAKILQFCNIFIKDASEISRNQKNEIIKYVRCRIPVFTTQIHKLLKNILNILKNLSRDEKKELINYLVPEIEESFSILISVIEEIKNSLDTMCKDLKCSNQEVSVKRKNEMTTKNKSNQQLKDHVNLFSKTNFNLYTISAEKQSVSAENDLKFVFYMYEVRKMRDIYGRISLLLDIIKGKKLAFCEMKSIDKISTINQNLEQLIFNMPTYISMVENFSNRFDEKIEWKQFKFCFKLATSQINGVVVKLIDHKPALFKAINQICKIIKKDEFTRCLIDLGLIEESNIFQNELKPSNMIIRDNVNYTSIKLDLIKHLCESPNVANSTLSKNALRLLYSGQLTDMEFQVSLSSNSQNKNSGTNKKNGCTYTFPAHRVIISSRCSWFKKAFLSGMLETVTRKILIPDTSPVIFRRLLLYLYGAPIDKTVGAEQICELMLLADRYSIDDLKELCEGTLNALIDEDSVVCLLSIADRYMASELKSQCLSFLSQHPRLTKLEIFKQLPQTIQRDVQDLIHWYGRVPEPWNAENKYSQRSIPKQKSRSRKSSPSYN